MPFPNEHSARLVSPKKNVKYRRLTIKRGLALIQFFDPKKNKWINQAYRFSKLRFTEAQAKAWLKRHKIKYIEFAPAK